MSKHDREKCGKLCTSSILSSKRGITPIKTWCKLTTLELDLKYSKTKSYAKFQLNMSKHVREKWGKLCISSILSSKRGITPTKLDANLGHSNLICSTVKQSHMQNFSSICQSMLEKSVENWPTETRTDGRTDGESDGRRPGRTDGWTDITIP